MDQLELDLLRRLVIEPTRLSESDITAGDFAPGQGRDCFAEISAIYEEFGPDEIDPAMLMSRLGGNGAAAFVGSLYEGNVKLGSEFFRDTLTEIRKLRLTRKMGSVIARQAEAGKKLDFEEIREDLEKYKDLDGKGFDPYSFMRTGSQLQALDVHVDWVVDKLVPEGAITLLHGPGGLGKTWLCLALAKAVSEGTPFLGLQTKRREVVYLDYENPLPVDHDRACVLNVCAPYFWHLSDPTRPPKLDGPDWDLLKALRPGSLLFIDTARGATDGDEIKGQDVALIMNRLKEIRELQHDIVLQAHTSKANKKISKGATTWEDLADHVLAFYRVRPGTLEEIEAEGFDPNAQLFLGTGNKTRYEPCRLYVSLDPTSGTFSLVADPGQEKLTALADYIAGEGLGKNQGDIIAWAKNNLGGGRTENLHALLKRGEREGRWRCRMGFKGAKLYEPPV